MKLSPWGFIIASAMATWMWCLCPCRTLSAQDGPSAKVSPKRADEPRITLDNVGRLDGIKLNEPIEIAGTIELPKGRELPDSRAVIENGFLRSSKFYVQNTTVVELKKNTNGDYSFRTILKDDKLPTEPGNYAFRVVLTGFQAPNRVPKGTRKPSPRPLISSIFKYKIVF